MARQTLKSGLSEKDRQKRLRSDLIFNCTIVFLICTYIGAVLGACALKVGNEAAIWEVFEYFNSHIGESLIKIFPCDLIYLMIGAFAGICVDVFMFDAYLRKKDIATNPHGDAAFETNYVQYGKEFIVDPNIVEKKLGRELSDKEYFYNDDDGHKKVVIRKISKEIYDACWKNTQIYSQNVALSINGKWCQRNANALVFGASGAGKSRFFLSPNLLQANGSYVITDPSGDIMQGFGAFLKQEGYIIKCLNVENMNRSCRFNPLYYIRNTKDIPIIVNSLLENTRTPGSKPGGDDFWEQSSKSLLCAIFGYLYEVEPLERRNFYNVLNLLRMAPQDENAEETVDTEFDEMFQLLGKKNPGSYAYAQYKTFKLAPVKTALSTLISTAVKFSTYVDVEDFNNLTFKDEMDLDKIGVAPYLDKDGKPMEKVVEDQYGNAMQEPVTDMNGRPKKDKDGNPITQDRTVPLTLDEIKADKKLLERMATDEHGSPIEGEPYKVALFLCIPQGDTTYNWIVSMMYSILFDKVYKAGTRRMADLNISNPELAIPVRFLIDECANIGKIPNLSEKLATCRKYRLSVVPIFQNYSQIVKVYGKEDANSIISNCDTTLFLGGADPETLKIITAHMGKETIKTASNSYSKASKGGGSLGQNTQQTGRELMSSYQIEQMKNSDCLVFIRAVRPFQDKKYPLQNHPNFKYTAEKDKNKYRFVNPFVLEYQDEEIESVRMKSIREDGFIAPKAKDSARGKAAKAAQNAARLKDLEGLLKEYDQGVAELDSKRTMNSESQKKRLKEHLLKNLEALKKDAEEYEDKEFIEKLREVDAKYGIMLFDDTIPEQLQKKEDNTTPMKSEESHRRDVEKAENAKKILSAQNGFTPPSTNPDDYSFVGSIDPFIEFEGSVVPPETLAMLKKYYTDAPATDPEEETKKAEEAKQVEENKKREEERKVEMERIAQARKEQQEKEAAEQKAREEEEARERAAALLRQQEADRLAEQKRLEEERKAKEEQEAREREAAEKAEQERLAKEKAEREAEEARIREAEAKAKAEQEERDRQEAIRLQKEKEEADRIAREAEEARKAEEARLAEEARKAEEARLAKEKEEQEERERLAREAEEKHLAEEAAKKAEEERLAAEAAKLEQEKADAKAKVEAEKKRLEELLAQTKKKSERLAIMAQLAALEEDDEDEDDVEDADDVFDTVPTTPITKPETTEPETTPVEEKVTETKVVGPVVETKPVVEVEPIKTEPVVEKVIEKPVVVEEPIVEDAYDPMDDPEITMVVGGMGRSEDELASDNLDDLLNDALQELIGKPQIDGETEHATIKEYKPPFDGEPEPVVEPPVSKAKADDDDEYLDLDFSDFIAEDYEDDQ